jgi:hypothetical protein
MAAVLFQKRAPFFFGGITEAIPYIWGRKFRVIGVTELAVDLMAARVRISPA